MKILIVDDSGFKRKFLAYILQSHEHEVLEAVDGVEGLEKARAYMPDFIISDLLMPRLDGFQFLREIKRDEHLRAIPVIIHSETFKEERERELALSLGASAFIEDIDKPDLLMNMIREIISAGKEAQGIRPTIVEDSDFLRAYGPIINANLDKKIRELEHERDMAQTYLDIVGVMLVAIGSDEKVTLINRKGREVLGYTEGEIIGKNWFDNFLPERSREEVRSVFRKITGGKPEAVEYYVNPVLTKRGEERIIGWHNTVLKDDSGNINAALSSGEDVTERRKAEEEIRGLSRFPDENPNPVMRVAADGTLLYSNMSSVPLLELWGCKAGGILPDHVRDLVSETFSAGQVRELVAKVDDSIYSLFFTPIAGSGYVNIYGRDVTETKRAEERLRLSEERFSKTFFTSPAGMTITRIADGKFIDVNDTFLRMFKFSRDEVIGHTSVELNMWSQEERNKAIKKQLESGGVRDFELQGRSKTGRTINLLLSSSLLVLEGETCHITTMIDISDRKKAEEELRIRNEELLAINRIISTTTTTTTTSVRAVLEKVMDDVLNIVGLEGATFCTVNPDETLHMVVHRAASDATVRDLTTHTIRIGGCLCGECARDHNPLILRDREEVLRFSTREAMRGEDIRFHAAYPLITGKKCLGVFCVFTRTDRKPTERSLKFLETIAPQIALAVENAIYYDKIQQNAAELERKVEERTIQLQTANKEMESFSYSVSHDLRAPLRAISGFAEIISERYRSGLNDEARHYIDNIIQSSDRMGHLIDDLLAYARLGRTTVRHEPVSLASIFGPLAIDITARLTEAGGTLKIADDLPTVMGDRTLLSRIFTNLVENALIYQKTGVPPLVEVRHENKNGRVSVKVSDNGIGIPSEHLEKIFNLFQRLHSDEEHPGTGVGLAIVKKSVELLGGKVRVESEVGKGSTFHIELQKSGI